MSKERLLRKSDDSDMLFQALDSVQEGITMIDKEGYIRYANRAAYTIMGAKREDVLHQKVDRLTKGTPLLVKILEKKKPIIDIEYFLDFKGKTVHLINSGYPVTDESGEIIGAIDIFRGMQRSLKLADTIAGYSALFTFDQIIGNSAKIKSVVKLAKAYSRNNENVLIVGESGTGKELFAQSIHNHSKRAGAPFIALNCANFPNDLIDSELFGYEEGAFTGASKKGKMGKFEAADGGTLFLDEIGEMPIHLQAKLLRVIETLSISRIGSSKPVHVDVKIIAATNRDLEERIREGHFRKDLYYRLKVLYLDIPPLRERESDIILLADHFVKKLRQKIHSDVMGLDETAKRLLVEHTWPGNVRELENVITRALVICEGEYITEAVLKLAGLQQPCKRLCAPVQLDASQVQDVLQRLGGNKKKTAEALGISRPTLYKLLKRK
ncbi:sigma-54 interaction domain-containing protein [Azotosporobacter soli]|uniref:sigma-54 interaction domain-containing protein n=1 Tax=Azotosporobacter soli TaxID=3055040 RepID=UPI0031FEE916